MSKKQIKQIMTLVMCVILTITMSSCGEKTAPNNGEETIKVRSAVIFSVNPVDNASGGTVSVFRDSETIEAYQGMRLTAGDSVSTDENSSVYLRIDDDKNILLGGNSRMDFAELKDGNLELKLNEGELFFDVENKIPNGENMSFDIGGTTMSIRGTSGFGIFTDEGCTFGLYDGTVVAKSSSGKSVEIHAFEKVTFNNGSDVPEHPVALTDRDFGELVGAYLSLNEYYSDRVDGIEDRVKEYRSTDDNNVTVDDATSRAEKPEEPAFTPVVSTGKNKNTGNKDKGNTDKDKDNRDTSGKKDNVDKEGADDKTTPGNPETPTDVDNNSINQGTNETGDVNGYVPSPYHPTKPDVPVNPSEPASPTDPTNQDHPASPTDPTNQDHPASPTEPLSPASPETIGILIDNTQELCTICEKPINEGNHVDTCYVYGSAPFGKQWLCDIKEELARAYFG